jgi:hypothetical protein
MFGDGRLRDIEFLGCFRKAFMFGDLMEGHQGI